MNASFVFAENGQFIESLRDIVDRDDLFYKVDFSRDIFLFFLLVFRRFAYDIKLCDVLVNNSRKSRLHARSFLLLYAEQIEKFRRNSGLKEIADAGSSNYEVVPGSVSYG